MVRAWDEFTQAAWVGLGTAMSWTSKLAAEVSQLIDVKNDGDGWSRMVGVRPGG